MPTEARVFAGGLPYNLPVKRPLSPVLKPTVRLRKDGPNWPAPGLDDTQLSKSGLPLELDRAQITDRRVSAFRVVEALDIVKYVRLCFIACPVRFVAGALGLQRREDALHRCVVPHVA